MRNEARLGIGDTKQIQLDLLVCSDPVFLPLLKQSSAPSVALWASAFQQLVFVAVSASSADSAPLR